MSKTLVEIVALSLKDKKGDLLVTVRPLNGDHSGQNFDVVIPSDFGTGYAGLILPGKKTIIEYEDTLRDEIKITALYLEDKENPFYRS